MLWKQLKLLTTLVRNAKLDCLISTVLGAILTARGLVVESVHRLVILICHEITVRLLVVALYCDLSLTPDHFPNHKDIFSLRHCQI